jgi:hypothetical protein
MKASSTWQQATERASGPTESSETESGTTPSIGTRRAVGLKPTTPFSAAGMRQEPPVSVPSPPKPMPSAAATPAPEEEPPGSRPVSRSQADFGVP